MSYRVTIKNQTYSFHVKTSRNVSSVSISHLLPNSNYNVSVVGLSEESEGIPSAWIRFKTRGEFVGYIILQWITNHHFTAAEANIFNLFKTVKFVRIQTHCMQSGTLGGSGRGLSGSAISTVHPPLPPPTSFVTYGSLDVQIVKKVFPTPIRGSRVLELWRDWANYYKQEMIFLILALPLYT